MEPIRLVIWDLDGVFWKGVLSEEGISYCQDNHDIVTILAKRGILSSICSKNDFTTVQQVLEAHDIWRYFIFPSVNWESKGKRVAALIETVQLRPESVLFIDDNPLNLAEALHYVPKLQIASHEFLPDLLSDMRFAGKDDGDLSRLKQYRLLEQKQTASKHSADDNHEFLRQSGMRLTIEYDIEAHLDRAIELINRTNQLNFTKRRLAEDIVTARNELRALTGNHEKFSGLIKLTDHYGDHGYIGFFCIGGRARKSWLHHFCFSCRVLNMGIERWVYRWLGRPSLTIAGEVACDPRKDNEEVDWISLADGHGQQAPSPSTRILDRLVMRGGCEILALSHYFVHSADELYIEASYVREGRMMRPDHSAFLNLVLDGVSEVQQKDLIEIGYKSEDWTSGISLHSKSGDKIAWVISSWLESFLYLYEHKQHDLKIPFCSEKGGGHNLLALQDEELRAAFTRDANIQAFEALKERFVGSGHSSESALQRTLLKLLKAAGDHVTIFFLLAPETGSITGKGRVVANGQIKVNEWIRAALSDHPRVHLVEVGDFFNPESERKEFHHFEQLTYYRIATHILSTLGDAFETPA